MQVRLNTRLFLNCLDGVSDEEAALRPNHRTNSLAFIACHVLDSRYFWVNCLGMPDTNPFAEQLGNAASIDDITSFPSLYRIRDAWRSVSRTLELAIHDLAEDELRAPAPQRFPIDDPSLLGAISFLAQHDSYHVGQLAMLRKFVGHPAMKYG